MGSEMCIRDRPGAARGATAARRQRRGGAAGSPSASTWSMMARAVAAAASSSPQPFSAWMVEPCAGNELTIEALREFLPEIDEDVFAALSIESTLSAKNTIGGTSPDRVADALAAAKKYLKI